MHTSPPLARPRMMTVIMEADAATEPAPDISPPVHVSVEQEGAPEAELETLKLLVSDLSRRLQNSQHTIDSQRRSVRHAVGTSEIFRSQVGEMSNVLRMEAARNSAYMRKKVKDEEAARYESDKKKSSKAHEDLRMAMIDQGIQGFTRETAKVTKLKTKLEKLEAQQDSQKLLLQHLGGLDKISEELSSACQHGSLRDVNILLRRGASVNEIDSAGYLPLHYAASNGFAEVVQLLLEFGSDASSYLTGHSAVELAARNGHSEVIRAILDFGGNIDDKGLAGSPPLVSAAKGGFVQCVDELLQRGADINAYDHEENTALHVATRLPDPVPLIRLLLRSGANTRATNRAGYTPLKMALANANSIAIEALGGRSALVEIEEEEDSALNDARVRDGQSDIASSVTFTLKS